MTEEFVGSFRDGASNPSHVREAVREKALQLVYIGSDTALIEYYETY